MAKLAHRNRMRVVWLLPRITANARTAPQPQAQTSTRHPLRILTLQAWTSTQPPSLPWKAPNSKLSTQAKSNADRRREERERDIERGRRRWRACRPPPLSSLGHCSPRDLALRPCSPPGRLGFLLLLLLVLSAALVSSGLVASSSSSPPPPLPSMSSMPRANPIGASQRFASVSPGLFWVRCKRVP